MACGSCAEALYPNFGYLYPEGTKALQALRVVAEPCQEHKLPKGPGERAVHPLKYEDYEGACTHDSTWEFCMSLMSSFFSHFCRIVWSHPVSCRCTQQFFDATCKTKTAHIYIHLFLSLSLDTHMNRRKCLYLFAHVHFRNGKHELWPDAPQAPSLQSWK